MARVKLKFRMVSQVMGSGNGGLLVVTDKEGERQVAIPCDAETLEMFSARMDKPDDYKRRLPEVLVSIFTWQVDLNLEIMIDGVNDGSYHAMVVNCDTLEQTPINDCDAVLLNFLSKDNIPLYMEERLFLRQSTRFDATARGVAMPINSITDAMLEEALKKAVADENYELASQLNDEMKRRKLKDGNKEATEKA